MKLADSLTAALNRYARALTGAVLLLGCALRLAVWLQQRSVYLDEVNLLRNIVERPYSGLFQHLDYAQYAPPFFLVLVKACVSLFGTGELAIRAVPLLSSIGALVLFRHLAGRWLPPLAAGLALGFVAFSKIYIDFATACKQYSTDALVCLALLALADKQLRRTNFSIRAAWGWAGLGAAAVWLSMPSVFVLAGVGAALLYQHRAAWRQGPGGRLAAVFAVWGLSFAVYFMLLLRADSQASNLQSFHREGFLVMPPHSWADLDLLGQQLAGIVAKAFGKTVLALVVATLGVGWAGATLWRQRPALAAMLLVPVAACLAASALHYYSLISRLLLFLMPMVVLLILWGVEHLPARRWLRPVALLAVVLTLLNQQRLQHLYVPFQADYADVRVGLAHVARHQRPGDTVFIYCNLIPIYYYYRFLHPRPLPLRAVVVNHYPTTAFDAGVARDLGQLLAAGNRRVWLVYDRPDPALLDWAARHGEVQQRIDFYKGYAFLLAAR